MDKRHVRVIDQFSEFYKRIGTLTGFNGVIYSVDFSVGDEDGNEHTKTIALEKEQFEHVRMPWFCFSNNLS